MGAAPGTLPASRMTARSGAGLADIAGLLAIGSAVLCKVAAGEPYLATAFAESVREADPALGESLAAVYWPGTSAPHLEAALRGAEAAVAYGSDESVRQVAARVRPGTLLLTYGHRLSLAVVGEGAPPDAAARAALDVAFYDQQGCVSPHTLYVLGDAAAFAEAMGAALDRLEGLHPRGPLRPGEAAAIRQARDEAEWKPGARLVGGAGDDLRWTVILDEADRALRPSPLMRTVRVHPLHTVAELPALVQAVRPWLQTCGFAGRPADAERLALLLGVSRICPLGRAQFPRLQWHHDGQAVLSRLVRWVDIEEEGAG
jgi:acyl-CoA reductase-like NAD-dependent aldehyde dehydrogenase